MLQFFCLWDDTTRLHGDRRAFSLKYYLCDDNIEISETFNRNGGRDVVPAFIKKQRIPREYERANDTADKVHGRNEHK